MNDSVLTYMQNHLDDYLADLSALVSIDSGSKHKPGVDAVNDWLTARLTLLGFTVERQPQTLAGDNLLARWQGRGRGHILLIGHSDTVFPVGTTVQRPMTINGNKIIGPGTCDMKAGLLTGLYAAAALSHSGFNQFGTLSYLCVSDEETDPRYSTDLIRAAARKADIVFTLEAARENGDIVTARKGVQWYTVEAFGRSAHAGVEPEKGRNAILALAHHLTALDRLNGLADGVTLNAGFIQGGGDYPSMVPDYAKMRLDVRGFSEADMQAAAYAIRRQLATEVIPGVRVQMTLEESSVFPPMERTPAVAELESLARQIAGDLGFNLRGASTGGASDASIAAAEGVPALDGLGPVGGLDHGPHEYIKLDSIVPRTTLLARLIMDLGIKYSQNGRAL